MSLLVTCWTAICLHPTNRVRPKNTLEVMSRNERNLCVAFFSCTNKLLIKFEKECSIKKWRGRIVMSRSACLDQARHTWLAKLMSFGVHLLGRHVEKCDKVLEKKSNRTD